MLLQHVWVSVRWDAFIVKMLFSPSVSWFLSIDPVSLYTKPLFSIMVTTLLTLHGLLL
jgi:hypothetical protein